MASKSRRNSTPASPARHGRPAKLPQLLCELLEDRTTPALFTVKTPIALGNTKNFGCVATGDFNNDGKTDLVMTNYGTAAPGASPPNNAGGNTVSILLGNGDGTFGSANTINIGTDQYVSFVAVGDLNGDGKQDLAVVSNNEDATGVLRIYLGNGSGGFNLSSQGAISTGSSNASWVGIAQVTNGDTNPDVVVCGYGNSDQGQSTVFGNNITVYQGDGTGAVNLINTVAIDLSFIPSALALADFDGDGKLDIAAAVPGTPPDSTSPQPNGTVQLFMGNGAGGFTAGNSFDSGGVLPISIQAADLNGDHKPDLVIANAGDPDAGNLYANFGTNSSIGLLINAGGGNFNTLSSLTAGLGVSGSKSVFAVTTADFDGDSNMDIAAIVYGNPLTGANARVLEFKGSVDTNHNVTFAGDANSPYNTTATDGQFLVAAPIDAGTTPDIVYCTDNGRYGVLINNSTAQSPASSLAVSGPSSTTAGVAQSFTVTAKDSAGNVVTGYSGTVHFTSTDVQAGLPSNYTFVAGDNGTHTFTITPKTAGNQSVTATDTVTGSVTGTTNITVTAAAASTFTVSAPSTAAAGASFSVTVKAKDQFGNIATGYIGTVHFTSSDGQAVLPSDYTFVAGDNGSRTFSATLNTVGGQTLVATDTATSSITGSTNVTVGAASANSFVISGSTSTTAGTSQSYTVTAKDSLGNTATGYTGTIHFTSTDGQAALPANYTFVAGDNGSHTFTITFKTAGSQSVTATDTTTSSITGTESGITVTAAAASTFAVTTPPSAIAGAAISVVVTAKDQFGNIATGYTGTVRFTSSDGQAALPANYTFVTGDNGSHTFSATLKTVGAQSVAATDTVTSSITGNASTTITAAAASTFAVSVPSSAIAGASFSVSVTAKDQFGNVATGYTGIVHFTSSDGQAVLPSDYTFVSGDNGVHTFSATLITAGTQSVTATDTGTSSITGSASLKVNAIASVFTITGLPSNTTAGVSQSFTVTAKDQFGNVATGYIGTVHFTSSDGQASLPNNYTFSVADNGVHTFNATLKTAGSQSVTATDTVTSSITGSASTTVGAAVANLFTVSAPSTVTAGAAFNVSVTAKDGFGNIATGYTGTVHFASSDGQATLPSDYTFVAGDNGTRTFSATLKTAGSQSVTATDTAVSAITGSTNLTVGAAAATTLQLSAPSTATAGLSFNTTVTLKDAYGNIATGYTGTVHFTSSDGQATLPSNYTFVAGDNGSHIFSVTLKTAGSQSVAAADTVTATIAGSTNLTVNAAAANLFTVLAPPTATAGASFNVSVTAKDAFGNIATGYSGTVHFASSDGQATLPSDYTFSGGDNGAHTFTATLKTAGSQSVSATDTVSSSITGSTNLTVGAAAASTFTVSASPTATAGVAFNVSVTAKDAFGNTAIGYTGSVHFTSSDGLAVLPANYTFLSGDNGAHTFSATLKTSGSQSVTATDTVTSSITGNANLTVGAAAATKLLVSAPSTAGGGVAFNATVTLKDAFGNIATGYTGTIHFTSSDGHAVLPANYTFVSGDSGVHTFSVTLKTAASQSVTATDTVTASITGSAMLTVSAPQPFAVGTQARTVATVTMYNPDQTVRFKVQPFGPKYRNGVSIAVGDVTGDGIPDVVAVTNGGIRAKAMIINGSNGSILSNNLLGTTQYTGKVSVAVGDINGDGIADIALGTGASGSVPRVRVFRGGDFSPLSNFTAGPAGSSYLGRIGVALGDMTGDGIADLVVTTLYSGRSRVVGYNGTSLTPGATPVMAFTKFALTGKYVSGLFLALGDVNADGRADIVIGSAGTRTPSVIVYSGQVLVDSNTRTTIASFAPVGSSKKTGVRVGVRDINGDGKLDILTSSGETVSAFQGGSSLPATGLPTLMFSFDPDPAVNGGVWVG